MSQETRQAPVVLLPGLLCDDFIWQRQVSGLPQADVIAIQGYGRCNTFGAMAEHVLAQAPARFALAGHSMGGRVALEVIRQAPERVVKLALLDTGVHPVRPGERDKRMALVRLGRERGIEALVDAWLPPMVHPARRDDASLMEPLRSMCIRAGLEQFENQVAALLSRPDATPQLARITCPTLVAVGRQDEWSPPEQHEEIAAALPDAHLVIFEDTGHMSTVESPDQVTAALGAWLEV
jgi:pimeloyl-ACP methyl ester carboxylesterase